MIQPTQVEIKPANIIDLTALYKIEQVCFGKDAWPWLDLVTVLSMPGIVRIKAIEHKQMIGFVSGDPKPNDGLGWVTSICILPEYQGKGIGRILLDKCEEQMGMPVVKLCVRRTNQKAIQIYKHLGYRQVGVWPAYYFDKEDGLIFERTRN